MSIRHTKYIARLKSTAPNRLAEGFFACAENPDIINLGTAENRVMNDELESALRNRQEMTAYDVTYAAAANDDKLREALARLYRDYFDIKDAKASQFSMGSGIAFLVEKLGLVLCEEDDIVLIPKPCYGCFEPDIVLCGAKVEYIDLDKLPEKPPEKARLLILTNPGNPIGDVIEEPEKLLEWCYQNPNLHIVSDDVYALSNRRGNGYKSIAGLPNAKPEVVHQCYGVSKDWGLAGCHAGFFWTRNEELLSLMKTAQGCFCLSSDTEWLITRMIGDITFRDNWIQLFRERLIKNESTIYEMLDAGKIVYRRCDYSLFIMIDLRDIAGTPEKELYVWRELMHKYRVHILPGYAGFHVDEPGFYRVIFSIPDEELIEGIRRVVKGVADLRAAAATNVE
ncbi:aminotransferase, classes I and II family protein [Tritrichomonas foetus]|uniref:Aminotransferase, classes I and II family protein n=1 Tax=Tritrichomonas foetus TaxID=1144522 RepID=A0A1J4KF16_9EUKA|nr:aminotransferase, classes I and II family protein [Tritrichomonas foetus]|eukprot:OHT09618.1 aminotransferase, classes I and II family protein [Tritrichomonas foetus]